MPPSPLSHLRLSMINELALYNHKKLSYALIKIDFSLLPIRHGNAESAEDSVR